MRREDPRDLGGNGVSLVSPKVLLSEAARVRFWSMICWGTAVSYPRGFPITDMWAC
jgi:hypothetical protein